MTNQVLFIQGGDEGTHDEWDNKILDSLKRELGPDYAIRYPRMPNEADPKYAEWKTTLKRQFAGLDDGAIVVGHSIGGTIVIKTLADDPPQLTFGGIFLIAPPFVGDGGWHSDDIELSDLGTKLPEETPIIVVGYTWRDEGEYLSPGGDGPWTAHFPKKPFTPEDEPAARKMAELMAALKSPHAGVGGDRTSLTLHPEDEQLILAVAGANPRTVVAIMAGSAVITESWRDKVAAILLLGYPGQEGGHAFADVLLGHVCPSGKLPFTMPRRADDLPFFDKDATKITYDLWHGYRKLERDNTAPAFPFGFGLSYTTFTLSDIRLAQDTIATDGSVMSTVDITNTGEVAGEEVVQLYVSARSSMVERAPRELKAFTKVALAPGETRTVRLAVPAASLAYYDEKNGWIVESGEYEVIVGRHSLDDEALRARFAI